MTGKTYRVHVHDHQDQGRWLAQADFARMPKTEDIPARLPVLADPGRYEVRVNVVHGEDEQGLLSYLTGEPASPQAVRVKRDGRTQKTFDSGDPAKDSNDAFAWLLTHQGQSVQHATRYEGWEITEPAPAAAPAGLESQPMKDSEMGRFTCVAHGGCRITPQTTINSDGVWVRSPDPDPLNPGSHLYSSAHRGCFEAWRADEAKDARLDAAAEEIAGSVTESARGSGDDPIAWVTGNAFMPPLRSFDAAEAVYQADPDGEDFAALDDLVEKKLSDAEVALECPDYDNALYAVDLRRFEYVDDPGDHETLQQDWQRKPVISQETLREVGHVAHHWPDGVHTREELEALEPGRRGPGFLGKTCECGCETEGS